MDKQHNEVEEKEAREREGRQEDAARSIFNSIAIHNNDMHL
jgi:hypothetical protein